MVALRKGSQNFELRKIYRIASKSRKGERDEFPVLIAETRPVIATMRVFDNWMQLQSGSECSREASVMRDRA